MSRSQTLKSVERALDIVEILKEWEGAEVTELAERLDIPKSTLHTYLTTLKQNGYVINENGTYHVGLGFLELGEIARSRQELYELGRNEVDKLAKTTGELVTLNIEEQGRGVSLYRSKGEQAVLASTHAGKHLPLHASAGGKAMLAEMPDERVKEIINQYGLNEFTDNTITDPEELREQLQTIRKRGYALDRGEQLEGLRCVGAAIVSDDILYGSISVTGPRGRLRGDRFQEELPEMIIDSKNIIEVNIVYSG